jgi:hypothetical protein
LRCGFEISELLSLAPQVLDCIHQLFALVNERHAQLNRPWQVLVHLGNHLREFRDRFDVLVPRLLVHPGNIVGVSDESGSLNYFERVGRCRKHNSNERIGMQRDRLGQFLEFRRALFR